MHIRDLLFRNRETSVRVLFVGILVPLLASLLIVIRLDRVFPNVRYILWMGLLGVAFAMTMYAGKTNSGILTSWISVFLAVVWLYVFPPLVAYVYGDMGGGSYTVLRPSVVGVSPYSELMTGLKLGPILGLLVALVAGSLFYLLGMGIERMTAPIPSQ